MKIIILSDFAFINGGNAQVALNTAVDLAQKGYNITLFTAVGPIADFLKNISNLRVICLNQYDILSDPNRVRAIINGLWNFKARREFKILLKNFDIKDTIIHIHSCSKALSSSCIQIANKMGFKTIYHLHDYGIACPNMGFYNYKKDCICKKKAMSVQCLIDNCDLRNYFHKLWRYIRQFIQIKISKMPDRISAFIAVSKFSANILKPYLINEKNIYFLENKITGILKNEKVEINKNKNIIFIGRLSAEKNPILLAKCAKEMDIPVIFIGDGPYKKEIEDVNDKAILTGWLNKKEMQKYIKKARVLVLTSSCYETQGMVVAEVGINGIPAIVPSNNAATDFVIHEYNGLIFKNKDINSLKYMINKILDDNFVKYLGNNVFNYYKQNENNVDYIKKLITIYEIVLKKDNI